mgnify:CR=1 FL=1
MKSASFFKILFSILAIFLLIVAGIFFISDSEELIKTVNENVVSAPLEKVFDPGILKWKLVITEAGFAKRDAHNIVVFKEKLWLFGGVGGTAPDYSKNYSDVWNSEDGESWTLITEKAPWGLRRAGEVLVFKDKIWLLGGVTKGEKYSNDVWSSEDGINWTLVTEHASWYERYDLAVELFLGKMWLSGGILPGEMGAKEVWYSENGFDWRKADKEIMWPGRHGHCFISYNNYLWIIGGWSGYGHGYNDVWYSKDGLTWNELYKDGFSPWPGREDLECIEFQNKLFIIGGMKSNGERMNDVWVLSEN